MAGKNDNDCSEVHFQQGSCRIILKQGDLMDEKDVDVIVIPTPEGGQQSGQTYPLFEALLFKASKNLKEEIKKRSSYIRSGDPPEFISSANPAIILTATPYRQNDKKAFQMLNKTYFACLNLAIDQQYETVAFPTIGCGHSGFPTDAAADNLYKALVQFQQSRNKQLKEIRIIVFKADIYNDFTNIFMKLGGDKNSKIKFVDISSKKSSITRMSSKENEKSDSQRHFHGDDTQHHNNDLDDDTTENRHGHGGKPKAGLDPESREFQPKSKIQRRDLRQYRINNGKTELHILQGDILLTKVDAIVNAANESMLGGSGVDGIIHKAAGRKLYEACEAHKEIFRDVRLPTGRSRILLSYNMSKTTYYIINTAGPRYDDYPAKKCKEYLTSCYKTSLELANLYDLKTIGFTAISCGIFGYPIDEGAEVALSAVDQNAGLMEKIVFVLKDDEIYDAWVKKAEQLQARSQNDTGSGGTSSSKQSTTNTQKPIEKPDSDDEPDAARRSARMKVGDESAADNTQKPVESDRKKPPEKPPSDPDETLDAQGTTEEAEDDSKNDKNENKNDALSESKEKSSNNSSKPSSKKNKTSESQPAQQDSKKQGSVVRSNNKNK